MTMVIFIYSLPYTMEVSSASLCKRVVRGGGRLHRSLALPRAQVYPEYPETGVYNTLEDQPATPVICVSECSRHRDGGGVFAVQGRSTHWLPAATAANAAAASA